MAGASCTMRSCWHTSSASGLPGPSAAARPTVMITSRCRSMRARRVVRFHQDAATPALDNAAAAAPPPPRDKKVKLSFRLPYRTEFGQDVAIVGSHELLGEWDPRRGLGMRWGEGDVWAVEFEVVAVGQRLDFAYKYVIRNADGSPALWKPGSDFSFSLAPGAGPGPGGGVAVRDAWDGSARDVRLEMRSGGGEGQHQQQQQRRQLTEQEQELLLYQQTYDAAMAEVKMSVSEAESLTGSLDDPTDPRALQADRALAAAARKATALGRALGAAQEQSRLAPPRAPPGA